MANKLAFPQRVKFSTKNTACKITSAINYWKPFYQKFVIHSKLVFVIRFGKCSVLLVVHKYFCFVWISRQVDHCIKVKNRRFHSTCDPFLMERPEGWARAEYSSATSEPQLAAEFSNLKYSRSSYISALLREPRALRIGTSDILNIQNSFRRSISEKSQYQLVQTWSRN